MVGPPTKQQKRPPTAPPPPPRSWKRWPYLVLAGISIALGFLGIVIPGLPTTPFLLLAAWAAARSSPRLHAWLHQHRWFGPPLRHWETQRAVATRSKLVAVLLLMASWVLLAWKTDGWLVPSVTGTLFVAVALFLSTRPTPR